MKRKMQNFLFTIAFLLISIFNWSVTIGEANHVAHKSSSGRKKIAFLFLVKSKLPLEEIWQEFFTWKAPKELYNIYVHPTIPYEFPETSVFHNKIIPKHQPVNWGTLGLVQATRRLMEAALEDPDNYYFPLFSESCLPLYSFPKFYRILTKGDKSIATACPHATLENMERSSRWRPSLDKSKNLKPEHWRKSGQWIMLVRPHAAVIVNYIEDDPLWESVPCSDEHFIPTILAMHGLDNQTTCSDGFTNVYWADYYHDAHPHTWTTAEIDKHLFYHLRFSKIKEFHHSPASQIISFNNQCSGYHGICHFAARKFSGLAKFHLLRNLQYLLIDDRDDIYDYQHPDDPPPATASESYEEHYLLPLHQEEGSGRYPEYNFTLKLFGNLRKGGARGGGGEGREHDGHSSSVIIYYLEQGTLRQFYDLYSFQFYFQLPFPDDNDNNRKDQKDLDHLISLIPVITEQELALPRYSEYYFPAVHENQLLKSIHKKEVWKIQGHERHLVPAHAVAAWNPKESSSIIAVSDANLEEIPVGLPMPSPTSKKFGLPAPDR